MNFMRYATGCQPVEKRNLLSGPLGLSCMLALAVIFAAAIPVDAKTLVITLDESDQIACISAKAPRMSWATWDFGKGVFDSAHQVQFRGGIGVIIRFPLESIPKGQRILKAELTTSALYVEGASTRIQVRRMLADWGAGVCHSFRRTYPEKQEWAQPGGRGAGVDRAAKDSAVLEFKAVGESTVDITEDVELWYTGGAANRGWMLPLENEQQNIYLASPYGPNQDSGKKWKLQITYEPE